MFQALLHFEECEEGVLLCILLVTHEVEQDVYSGRIILCTLTRDKSPEGIIVIT